MDAEAIRARFPIFERLVYVNSCSQGALSLDVRGAYEQYLADWDERGAPWEYWVAQAEEARGAFARLVNAAPHDVAVTTSVSAAVSAIATGLDISERPRIVVTDLEFPTIGQIWHAQEARGAEVVHVRFIDGTLSLDHLSELVDERTALVAVTAICYRNGYRTPLDDVLKVARESGALVLLDAYQALGTYPIDVSALGVDFLVGGALKYLLGSAGLAFLWARPEVTARILPLATGWFADHDIFAMDGSDYSPASTARRFESGTPPIPAIYAGIAGMQLLEDAGITLIEAHVRTLTAALVEGIEDIGGAIVTPRDASQRGALVCARSVDAPALVAALAEDGIVASERDSNIRISPHLYNNDDDIHAVLRSLERHRSLLAQ